MIDGWSKSLVFPFVALLVESKLAGSIFFVFQPKPGTSDIYVPKC